MSAPSNTPKQQQGNVLFLILIAVALFAALTFAITKSARNGTDAGAAEKNKLAISEIRTYTSELTSALNRLVIANSCPLENVSFESAIWPTGNSDYVNNYSPSSKKCHVFAPEGGRIVWKNPTANLVPGTAPLITGMVGVQQSSASCANTGVVMLMINVTRDMCLQVNNENKVTNTGGEPPQWASGPSTLNANWMRYGFRSHSGSANLYCNSTVGATGAPSAAELRGKLAGCFQSTTGTKPYIYYSVLYRN